MTNTKANKILAIVLTLFIALSFLSLTVISANAEGNTKAPGATQKEDTSSNTQSEPKSDTNSDSKPDPTKKEPSSDTQKDPSQSQKDPSTNPSTDKSTEPTSSTIQKQEVVPEFKAHPYTAGAPDVDVTINFKDNDSLFKFSEKELEKDLPNYIHVYSDKTKHDVSTLVYTKNLQVKNPKYENHKLTFTVELSKATGLQANKTYYLVLNELLSWQGQTPGKEATFEFKTKGVQFNTRSTRTLPTKGKTIKAKAANTGDPSELPLWIGIAAVAAILGGAVVVAKERESSRQ